VYREFMQANGIPYTPNAYAPDDGDPVARAKLPAGNQILEINAYLSATMRPGGGLAVCSVSPKPTLRRRDVGHM